MNSLLQSKGGPAVPAWRRILAVFVSAFALMSTIAGATVAADSDALVKEGVALRRSGDDVAALKKFEQAHAIEQSARTMAQIGLAEQALGRWGASDRHLRAALAMPGDPWVGKNRKSIEQALKTVEQHVGSLEIVGSPAGAEVRVDGELVGKLPLERAVAATAGSVAVELRAPGYLPAIRSSQITVGGVTRESFNLQPTTPVVGDPSSAGVQGRGPTAVQSTGMAHPGPMPDPSPGTSGAGSEARPGPPPDGDAGTASDGMPAGYIAAIVAGGLAAGALAVGIFEHVKWQDRVSTFEKDDTCNPDLADRGSWACKNLYDEGRSARTVTFVSYGLAAALGATAVISYLLTPPPASRSQVSMTCAPDPGTLGVSCGGRF